MVSFSIAYPTTIPYIIKILLLFVKLGFQMLYWSVKPIILILLLIAFDDAVQMLIEIWKRIACEIKKTSNSNGSKRHHIVDLDDGLDDDDDCCIFCSILCHQSQNNDEPDLGKDDKVDDVECSETENKFKCADNDENKSEDLDNIDDELQQCSDNEENLDNNEDKFEELDSSDDDEFGKWDENIRMEWQSEEEERKMTN